MEEGARRSLQIALPDWVDEIAAWDRRYTSDEERVRLTIALARENVVRGTGGPFGAAVFESESGALVSVGVNSVVRLNNSSLHGEMVAFMLAQQRVGNFSLAAPGLPRHELVTSCEPCAMCLGATLWSGVRRLVFAATRDEAARLRFDEGPVFPESHDYLRARGITITGPVLRDEALHVFELYRSRQGPIYNA
jgi:tRNA(Arg) A34 adenosine deaminase TadA